MGVRGRKGWKGRRISGIGIRREGKIEMERGRNAEDVRESEKQKTYRL